MASAKIGKKLVTQMSAADLLDALTRPALPAKHRTKINKELDKCGINPNA